MAHAGRTQALLPPLQHTPFHGRAQTVPVPPRSGAFGVHLAERASALAAASLCKTKSTKCIRGGYGNSGGRVVCRRHEDHSNDGTFDLQKKKLQLQANRAVPPLCHNDPSEAPCELSGG